jgi:integrase
MDFTVFRRHNRDVCKSKNRYDARCGCPLHVQFLWKGIPGIIEGRKLAYQNKWSLETRTWSETQSKVKKLEKRLTDFSEGKVVVKGKTVEGTVKEWLAFRERHGKGNVKAELMGRKLVRWCEEENISLLSGFTTDRAVSFQVSLPFRTGNSDSLKIHWSVIGGFFSWAVGMGYIDRSPIPDTRMHPQFKIVTKKAEVKPPTAEQVEKILAAASGQTRLLCQLMRESAMALVDAVKFGMGQEDAEHYGMSKPERRPEMQDGVIRGQRTKTNERYRVRISDSLAKQLAVGTPFHGTLVQWRERVNKVIAATGIKTTPHGFRHYRISEWLSAGVHVDDVADMVGTSSKEIRKTYRHWIKEAEDRLDDVQRQAWLRMGLDENGDKIPGSLPN